MHFHHCSFLDGPIHKHAITTYSVCRNSILIFLIKKAEDIASRIIPEDGPTPAKQARPGLGFMKDRSQSSSEAVGTLFEINNYLFHPCMPDDANILLFWKDNKKKYPTLARLASIYLAIPAFSAPVERIFSISGKIFRPECCSL